MSTVWSSPQRERDHPVWETYANNKSASAYRLEVRQCCALQGAVPAVGYETAERFGGNSGLLAHFRLAWATSTMQQHTILYYTVLYCTIL